MSKSGLPRLGILQTGHAPKELQEQHGDYDRMFATLLGEDTFDYATWAVVDNVFPDNIDAADAWLITGSRHGAYEEHAWIPPLETLIRESYAAEKPMVGICFGHQIMAQALGGKVEKFDGGWSVGRVAYSLDNSLGLTDAPLLAYHQDQVVELPPNATVVGSSSICQYAAVTYGDRTFSLQPHPEFDNEFVAGLIETRGHTLPESVRTAATDSLGKPLATNAIANVIKKFLLGAQDS